MGGNVGRTKEEGIQTEVQEGATQLQTCNVLLCWHSNRPSNIFISQSLHDTKESSRRNTQETSSNMLSTAKTIRHDFKKDRAEHLYTIKSVSDDRLAYLCFAFDDVKHK